ncbi:MAG: T9SS type A sorting domain-containing protein, partial [Gemmatimonadota bacterium]
VRDDIYGTMPGDTTSIRFSKFLFNEGRPMSETENGFFMVNREPEIVTSVADTLYVGETEQICLTFEAFDPDNDSLILWNILDPYPCDGAEPDTAYGRGSVSLEWCWTPPKMGACDTLACSLFVKSTMPDSLMDTLTTVIVVDDCELLVSWPDTTGYACGWIEIPVRVHPDYDCLADLDVVSAYFELDYDTDLLTVGEVGNEGLMTEHWGALIHNLDEENGKIYVALAGNYPLPQCDPICTWYDFLYVGFQVNAGVTSEDSAALSVDYVKFNEGDPMACWIDTTWLYFREFSITGKVYYSDPPYLPVPGVSIFKGGICDEGTFEILTDETGAFGITPLDECAGLCVWPEMENTLTVQDQIVTSYDATMILRMICGSQILSHNDSLARDVTANWTISAFDASAILKWVVTGHIGSDLIPSHFIGDWIFESDLNCDITGFKDPCVCFPSFVEDVDLCWEAVITGDVSQNWPGSPAKVAVGELDAEVVDKTLQVNVGSARAVDMVISGADLKITDVLVEGLVEWAEDGEGLHVAAASETELGMITIIFERLVPGRLDVVARIDEDKVLSSVVKVVPIPTEYSLAQNYPNPFNPVTTIEYALPEASIVRLEVFNILGQKVTELVNTKKESGYYRASWNSDKVTSGIYFYRMTAGDFIATKRMVLMK